MRPACDLSKSQRLADSESDPGRRCGSPSGLSRNEPTTLHFLINPFAGGVRDIDSLSRAIRSRFKGFRTHIHTRPIGDIAGPIQESFRRDARDRTMVVAVGGDGAVNRMINLFEKSGVPMGLLPLGTSNDFAQALGISLDLDEACAVIRGALLKEVDIISVNGKSFVTCGGLGLASAAASRANGWKTRLRKTAVITRLLGKNIYALAALLESLALHRPLHACIHHNGNVKERDWVTLIIGNQPQLGGFTIPSSSNTDGLFHLSAVEYPDSRVRMLWMLWQGLRGRLDTCRHVTHEDARSISITTPDSSSFFGDGDILAHARHFRIEIRPRAIRVSVPRESMIPPQPSPSGPQPSRTEESEVRHG